MTPAEIRALADKLAHTQSSAYPDTVDARNDRADLIDDGIAALRAYAALLREREGEERLLDAGWWLLTVDTGKPEYMWSGPWKTKVQNEDRATATRLALEALNGK